MGRIGIKVWIYKGEILPPVPEAVEEMETIEVRVEQDDPNAEPVDDDIVDDLDRKSVV